VCACMCVSIPVSKGFSQFSIFKKGGLPDLKRQLQVADMDSGCRIHVPVLNYQVSIFRFEMQQFSTSILYHGKVAKPKTAHVVLRRFARPSWEFPITQSSNQSNHRGLAVFQVWVGGGAVSVCLNKAKSAKIGSTCVCVCFFCTKGCLCVCVCLHSQLSSLPRIESKCHLPRHHKVA
jgi:hypothetical protein